MPEPFAAGRVSDVFAVDDLGRQDYLGCRLFPNVQRTLFPVRHVGQQTIQRVIP